MSKMISLCLIFMPSSDCLSFSVSSGQSLTCCIPAVYPLLRLILVFQCSAVKLLSWNLFFLHQRYFWFSRSLQSLYWHKLISFNQLQTHSADRALRLRYYDGSTSLCLLPNIGSNENTPQPLFFLVIFIEVEMCRKQCQRKSLTFQLIFASRFNL